MHAVCSGQNATDDAHQWLLPQRLLHLASRDDDIEQLIRAAHLNICLHGRRVVALHQRVKRLMQKDGFPLLKSIGKIFARQKLLDGEILPQPDQIHQRKFREPFAVVAHLCLRAVEHAKGLVGVRLALAATCSWVRMGRALFLSEGSPTSAV